MDGAYDQIDHTDPTLVRVAAWAQHPFSTNMGVVGWLLFLGLILCGVVLWTRVLNHFAE